MELIRKKRVSWQELFILAFQDLRIHGAAFLWAMISRFAAIILAIIALTLVIPFLEGLGGFGVLIILAIFFLSGYIFIELAVNWHRWIIMDAGTFVPAFGKPGVIWSYFWRSVVIAIMASLMILPVAIVIQFLVHPELGNLLSEGIARAVLQLAYFVAFAYFCVILPAKAAEKRLNRHEAKALAYGSRLQIGFALFVVEFPIVVLQSFLAGDETELLNSVPTPGMAAASIAIIPLYIIMGWLSVAVITRAYLLLSERVRAELIQSGEIAG